MPATSGRFLDRMLMRFVHMLVFFVHMLVIRMGVVMLFVRRGLRFLLRAVSLLPALGRLGVMRVLGVGRLDEASIVTSPAFSKISVSSKPQPTGFIFVTSFKPIWAPPGSSVTVARGGMTISMRHDDPRGVGVDDDLADRRGPRADQLVGRVALVLDDHEQRRGRLAIARRAQPGMLDGDIARLIFVGSGRRASLIATIPAGRGTQKGVQQVASIRWTSFSPLVFAASRQIRWRARASRARTLSYRPAKTGCRDLSGRRRSGGRRAERAERSSPSTKTMFFMDARRVRPRHSAAETAGESCRRVV